MILGSQFGSIVSTFLPDIIVLILLLIIVIASGITTYQKGV